MIYQNTSFLIFLLGVLAFSACRNPKKPDYIEKVNLEEIPNRSDINFEEALLAFKEGETQSAIAHIEQSITELETEIADGEYSITVKEKAERAITNLQQLVADIQADKVRDTDRIRETFANAALVIAHDYLLTDDLLVLQKPTKAQSTRLNRKFDKASKAMEILRKEQSTAAKKAKERLLEEAARLKQSRKELEEKMVVHLNKVQEYIQTHHPEEETRFPYYDF